jgi:quinol monooxygenase YgiN
VITVSAVQHVKPGKEGDVETLMQDLTNKVRANEPGCLTFDYVRSNDDDHTYLVIEQYADDPAFALHRNTEYLQAFIPHLLECLVKPPEVVTYRDVLPLQPTTPSFFHSGVVVPDLERAIACFSEVLGLEFTEPATFVVPRLEDPDPHHVDLVCAFSRSAPPYYELIQAQGDGIISVAQSGRILYYGIWETDMGSRLEKLRRQGIGVDALFRMDADSPPFAMITAPDMLGARIEYVDYADKGPIEEWVRTGKFPGGVGG